MRGYSSAAESTCPPLAPVLLNWNIQVSAWIAESLQAVSGVDLGGTAITYELSNTDEQILIESLCE